MLAQSLKGVAFTTVGAQYLCMHVVVVGTPGRSTTLNMGRCQVKTGGLVNDTTPVWMRPIVDRQTPVKTLPSLAVGKYMSVPSTTKSAKPLDPPLTQCHNHWNHGRPEKCSILLVTARKRNVCLLQGVDHTSPPGPPPPRNHKSGRYASYWKAFLFIFTCLWHSPSSSESLFRLDFTSPPGGPTLLAWFLWLVSLYWSNGRYLAKSVLK